jgi:hypothetical protein
MTHATWTIATLAALISISAQAGSRTAPRLASAQGKEARSPAEKEVKTSSAVEPKAPKYRFNFETQPLSLLVGHYTAGISVGLTESLSLGPLGGVLKLSSSLVDLDAYTVGLRATYHLSGPRFTQGWLLATEALYVPVTIRARQLLDSREYGGNTSMTFGRALLGYQFFGHGSFNVTAAAGASYHKVREVQRVTASDGSAVDVSIPQTSGASFALDLKIGFAL